MQERDGEKSAKGLRKKIPEITQGVKVVNEAFGFAEIVIDSQFY
jgi:hypothetical protein